MPTILILSKKKAISLDTKRIAPVSWIYTGTDQSFYLKLQREYYKNVPCLISPRNFQRFVAQRRSEFVEWVDTATRNFTPKDWLINPFNKNPLVSNIFLYFCWLRWFKIRFKSLRENLIVVVDEWAMGKAVSSLGHMSSVIVVERYGALLFTRVLKVLKRVVSAVYHLLEWTIRSLWSKKILGRAYPVSTAENAVIITNYYFRDSCVDGKGRFHDTNFPGLVDWYAKHKIVSLLLPWFYKIPLRQYGSIYHQISRCHTKFLLVEQLLPFHKMIEAIYEWIKIVANTIFKDKLSERVKNDVLYPIVRSEEINNAFTSFSSFLMGYIPFVLFKRGIQVTALIQWYENQPKDKYLLLNFKQMVDHLKIVAVQQYITYPNLMSLFITNTERRLYINPNFVWVTGHARVKYNAVNDSLGLATYMATPPLRYQGVYQTLYTRKQKKQIADKGFTLLILLSYSLSESINIIYLANSAMNYVLSRGGEVWLKPHPTVEKEIIRRKAMNIRLKIDNRVLWANKAVSQLLIDAKLVISGGSSAALEAVLCGVPTVITGNVAGLDMNPLEGINKSLWSIGYNESEVLEVVKYWMSGDALPVNHCNEIGEQILRDHFMEATESNMLRYLAVLHNTDNA